MRLRPMTMADADKMLEWKNYAETRMFAIVSKARIKKENHYVWLKNNLQHFRIIEDIGEAVGAIRIQNKEVSIWIDRSVWGEHIASIVLTRYTKKGMWAKIVHGNIGSIKCFTNAGFRQTAHNDIYAIFKR